MPFTKFGSSEAYGFLALLPCSLATIGAVFSLSFATSFCGAPIARCRKIRLGLQYGVSDRQSWASTITGKIQPKIFSLIETITSQKKDKNDIFGENNPIDVAQT